MIASEAPDINVIYHGSSSSPGITMSQACIAIASATQKVAAKPKAPSAISESHWSAYLNDTYKAAADCMLVAGQNAGSLAIPMIGAFNSANKQLTTLESEVKTS